MQFFKEMYDVWTVYICSLYNIQFFVKIVKFKPCTGSKSVYFVPVYSEEVRRLESEIHRQKKEYDILQEKKCQALDELKQVKKLHSEQQAQSLDQSQKIKDLHRQLEAKEELVTARVSVCTHST